MVKAFLQTKRGEELGRLYVIVKNIWIKTGVKVKPASWDNTKQKIKATMPGYEDLNRILLDRKLEVGSAISKLQNDGVPITNETLNQALEKQEVLKVRPVISTSVLTTTTPVNGENTVDVPLEKLLRDFAVLKKGKQSPNYLRKFPMVADHVKGFSEKQFGVGASILAKDFNYITLMKFIDYLIETQDLANNSIKNDVELSKRVMKFYATRDGIQVNKEWLEFKYKYIKPMPLWLTQDELKLLEDHREEDPYLESVREEFLFRCYTGLRFSDAQQLRPHHFFTQGKEMYVNLSLIKTDLNLSLVLEPRARALVKKWKGNVPQLIEQPANRDIKEVCRKATINTKVEKLRHQGSSRTAKVIRKYLAISTHTARRTFGRHWMEKGGNLFLLMKFYGHAEPQTTMDYIGWSGTDMNNELIKISGNGK